ncbi:serine/threonine-protein kinase RsbW [Clostridium cavendishii DSM 21758]|uniref:Serine/threonine-protein kinase RsbW n=1 Tax=Clostridium cavendishii DSM 21758 TaxID=1121302 RepID=A0A1M6UGN0_9CLOT|nr:ATP-binding protein [Clostridium cavendishii]SHK68303.1 serine/threonine-protein kinase RsbW [Clostridium cavendishii DSM 21758]
MRRKGEFILYGLSKYKETIDEIICDLGVCNDGFDIRLMLTEALTNSFKHGNKGDKNKPIYLRYFYYGTYINFEIEDCGNGFHETQIYDTALEEDILSNSGRGLFIISSIADKMEVKNNVLILQKQLKV